MELCLLCLAASALKTAGTYTIVVVIPAIAAGAGGQIISQLMGS